MTFRPGCLAAIIGDSVGPSTAGLAGIGSLDVQMVSGWLPAVVYDRASARTGVTLSPQRRPLRIHSEADTVLKWRVTASPSGHRFSPGGEREEGCEKVNPD